MRGSPLLNALLAFVLIAFAGVPVYRLTRATASPTLPAQVQPEPAAAAVLLELRFTAAPESVRIRHLGKVVWSAERPGSSAEAELNLPWPEEGIDLLFEVGWPEDAPLAAARVALLPPDGEEQIRSIWGTGQASEVFTFR